MRRRREDDLKGKVREQAVTGPSRLKRVPLSEIGNARGFAVGKTDRGRKYCSLPRLPFASILK